MSDVVRIGDATLYHGDCREVLPIMWAVPDAAVITDPPYGIGLPYGDAYDDSPATYWPWFRERLAMLRSLFAPVVFTHRVSALHELTDWDWCGVWNKPGAFGSRLGNSCVLPHWEPIFLYGIHKAGTASTYTPDVFTFNPEPAKANIRGIGREKWIGADLTNHPCPKPVALYERLVEAFGQGRSAIVDPFMGSGTTGVACANLGRPFVGVEIERKYFDIACERIDNAYRQQRMFA